MNTSLQKDKSKNTSLARQKKQSVAKLENKIPLVRSIILNSVDNADIHKIYLFGSYAYGNPKESSDIDICVIIKDTADRPKTYLKIAMNLTDNAISPCDLIVCRESEFYHSNNPKGIEYTIMEKGKLLYAC